MFYVRLRVIGKVICAIGVITPLSITAPAYFLCSVNSSSRPKALITSMLGNCITTCGVVESSLCSPAKRTRKPYSSNLLIFAYTISPRYENPSLRLFYLLLLYAEKSSFKKFIILKLCYKKILYKTSLQLLMHLVQCNNLQTGTESFHLMIPNG